MSHNSSLVITINISQWCKSLSSYSYTTGNGKNVCKVKGFTLNYENSQYINQESMKQLIQEKKDRITIVNENKITRD